MLEDIFKCRAAEKQQNASTPNNHRGHYCGRDDMVFQPGQGRQGDTADIIGSRGLLKLLGTGLLACLLLASYSSRVSFSSCALLRFTSITSCQILV